MAFSDGIQMNELFFFIRLDLRVSFKKPVMLLGVHQANFFLITHNGRCVVRAPAEHRKS